jgi:hypothetical protein
MIITSTPFRFDVIVAESVHSSRSAHLIEENHVNTLQMLEAPSVDFAVVI